MELLKLGTIVTDSASELKGMLTHAQISPDHSVAYLFQPKGINPETGQPVDPHWIIGSNRIKGAIKINVDIPMEILGTIVTDNASGFKGEAIHLTLHINGCVHALVQPKGTIKKTCNMIMACDFDVRRLSGKKIPKLTEIQKNKSMKKHPSPAPCSAYTPTI